MNGFEVDVPMVVEVLTFPAHPGLNLRLLVRLSLVANGRGHVYAKDYDIEVVREDRSKATFPIEGVAGTIEEALRNGESPLVSVLERNSEMLGRVGEVDRRIETIITAKQIMAASSTGVLARPKDTL